MEQVDAFNHVIAAMEQKISELRKDIEAEDSYILKRRMSEEIKSYLDSIEHLQDIMVDLKLI